jgi:hypothetical protein
MKCIACKAQVGSGGDRHQGVRVEAGTPNTGIGCSVRGRIGDRGHSLLPARRSSGAESTVLFNARGGTIGGLKRGGSRGKGQAEKK